MNKTIFNKTFWALGFVTSALTLGSCGDDDDNNKPDTKPYNGIVAYYDVSGTILNTEKKPLIDVEITIENVFETGEEKTILYETNTGAYFINSINTEGEYHKVGFLNTHEPIWNMRHFRIIATPLDDEYLPDTSIIDYKITDLEKIPTMVKPDDWYGRYRATADFTLKNK